MHELAICKSLIREAEKIAKELGASTVREIRVSVGPLSGINARQLANVYRMLSCGTKIADATLVIDEPKARILCKVCFCETSVPVNDLRCRCCHSWRVEIMSGDELYITELKVT